MDGELYAYYMFFSGFLIEISVFNGLYIGINGVHHCPDHANLCLHMTYFFRTFAPLCKTANIITHERTAK